MPGPDELRRLQDAMLKQIEASSFLKDIPKHALPDSRTFDLGCTCATVPPRSCAIHRDKPNINICYCNTEYKYCPTHGTKPGDSADASLTVQIKGAHAVRISVDEVEKVTEAEIQALREELIKHSDAEIRRAFLKPAQPEWPPIEYRREFPRSIVEGPFT